jgi:hypothetical protein
VAIRAHSSTSDTRKLKIKKGGLFQRVEDLEDSVAEVVEGVEAVPKRNREGSTAEEISPLSFPVGE